MRRIFCYNNSVSGTYRRIGSIRQGGGFVNGKDLFVYQKGKRKNRNFAPQHPRDRDDAVRRQRDLYESARQQDASAA